MAEETQALRWTTVKKKVRDLLPNYKNPRKWRKGAQEELDASLSKFDQVAPSVCNADGSLIDGHRRLEQMMAAGWEDREVDVRIPNRQLSQEEVGELMIRMNTHQGTWDFDALKKDDLFSGFDLDSMGLQLEGIFEELEREATGKPQTKDVRPYQRTHVLISFHPSRILELQPLLEMIAALDFVEYEQSSNG